MKKILLAICLLGAANLSNADASRAFSVENFHSWNKPLNPAMASFEEMSKYRADVADYVKQLDEDMKRIRELKHAAMAEFNKAASKYNHDEFFHKGAPKIKLFERKHHRIFPDSDIIIIQQHQKKHLKHNDMIDEEEALYVY